MPAAPTRAAVIAPSQGLKGPAPSADIVVSRMPTPSRDNHHVTAGRRIAPFAVWAMAAFLLVPVNGGIRVDWPEVIVALVLSAGLGVALFAIPLLTTGRAADLVAIAMLALIALLRDGTGGGRGGYGVVVLVPVLWVALYGSRRQLLRVLVAAAVALFVPLAFIGAPDYPSTGWRGVPLLLLSVTLVGVIVQALLARERAGAARQEMILSAMHDGFALTREGRIVEVNPALSELTGFTRAELVGARAPFPFWPPEALDALEATRARIVADGGGTFETTFRRADGSRFTAEVTAVLLARDPDGGVTLLNTMRDVTARKEAERAIEARSEQLAAIAAMIHAVAHAGPDEVGETICELAREATSASTAAIWVADRTGALRRVALRGDAATAPVPAPDALHRSPLDVDGSSRSTELLRPIVSADAAIGVLALSWPAPTTLTATEAELVGILAREAEAALAKAAEHARLQRLVRTDPLTGLPNRRSFEEAYRLQIATAEVSGRPFSLAVIDLDRFKAFNDARGHLAGDALLSAIGHGWAQRIRSGDLLARWGGEEFCLLLPGCDPPAACLLIDELRADVPEGQTFSAGVAAWRPGSTAEALLERADAALFAAKAGGRARTVVDDHGGHLPAPVVAGPGCVTGSDSCSDPHGEFPM